MGRKKRKAIDPKNTDRTQVAAFQSRFGPKKPDLAPRDDDSDLEETISLKKQKLNPKNKRDNGKKKQKKNKDENELDEFNKIDMSQYKVIEETKDVRMPVMREGESYATFKQRVKKVQYQQLIKLAEVQRQKKVQLDPVSEKRKTTLNNRKTKLKQRGRSPSYDLDNNDTNTKSTKRDFEPIVRPAFNDIVEAPPKLQHKPKQRQRILATNISQETEAISNMKEELTEEEEREAFRARLAARSVAVDKQRAMLAYKSAKQAKHKTDNIERQKNFEKNGIKMLKRGSDESYGNL